MTKELKNCPFCGGDRIMFMVEGYFKPWESGGLKLWYKCKCYECGAEGLDEGTSTDMGKAMKNWNERAEAHVKALIPLEGKDITGKNYKICRNCSAIVEDGEWRASYCSDCGKPVDWQGGGTNET